MYILFVCKHNMFRSKIAESYFRQINKNKNLKIGSAWIVRGYLPLDRDEVSASKSLGIKLDDKPKGVSINLLKKQDLIIIVADDVPLNFLNDRRYVKPTLKVVKWNIKDNPDKGEDRILKIIKQIVLKVNNLYTKLN